MGTEITLDVAGVPVTYSKNHRGVDHGSLFQERDRKVIKSDQIDYDRYEKEGEDATPSEMGFARPLKDVVPRLELLGFDLERVRCEYESLMQDWLEEKQPLQDDGDERLPEVMTFAEFREFATAYPLANLDDTFVWDTDNTREETIRGRFKEMRLERVPGYACSDFQAFSERSFFGGLVNVRAPRKTGASPGTPAEMRGYGR